MFGSFADICWYSSTVSRIRVSRFVLVALMRLHCGAQLLWERLALVFYHVR